MTAPESTTSSRRVQAAERERQAVSLRIAGATYAQIAERLGVTPPAVYKMVTKHLVEVAKHTADSAEQLRAMELQRLDALQVALWPAGSKGDLQAIDRLLKIQVRRAALLGLDAPTKTEVQQTLTHVEAYEYGNAIAAIAPGPVAHSPAPGDDQDSLHGPAMGENPDGG